MKFTVKAPGCDRIHHVDAEDVRVVLDRLPEEVRGRLRAVHFQDRSRGGHRLGYVTRGRREITLCALPPRVSFTRALTKGQTPEMFGARWNEQWPPPAVRRFLLYDVLLHELGHLQIVEPEARTPRLKFARETLAQEFGMCWCKRLWSEPFDHPDPVHNPPTASERDDEDIELTDLIRRSELRPDSAAMSLRLGKALYDRERIDEARIAYERSTVLAPNDPWPVLCLGNCFYTAGDHAAAVATFERACRLMPERGIVYWGLADVQEELGLLDEADANYRKAVAIEPSDRTGWKKLRDWEERSGRSAAGVVATGSA